MKNDVRPLIASCLSLRGTDHSWVSTTRIQSGITCDILCLKIATPCCQVSKTIPLGSARYYPVLVSLKENVNQISDPTGKLMSTLWQIGTVKSGLQCGRRRLNRNITSYSLLRGSNRKPTSPARLCTPRLLLLAAENAGRKGTNPNERPPLAVRSRSILGLVCGDLRNLNPLTAPVKRKQSPLV